MQEDLIRKPVELIDEDLDIVAGGWGSVEINIADVDQYINQVQIGGKYNDQAAANVSSVDQQN